MQAILFLGTLCLCKCAKLLFQCRLTPLFFINKMEFVMWDFAPKKVVQRGFLLILMPFGMEFINMQ